MSERAPTLMAFARNNRTLKLAAVAIAIITWYAVRRATSYETLIKDVPLTVLRGEGWSVLDRSVGDVDVLFSGTLQDLQFLSRDQIKVEVDTRNVKGAGTADYRITARHVAHPGGARVVRVEPDLVRLSLDREEVKTVPVRADIVGSPPEGIEVAKVECSPASVVVHGPRQRLEEIDTIRSVPIDLEGRMRSFEVARTLREPSGYWSARMEPGEVRVAVTLVERRSSRNIGQVRVRPLMGAGESAAVTIQPSEVVVRLEGEVAALQQATSEQVLAFVDSALARAQVPTNLPVRISAPVGLRAVAVEPATVRVLRGESGGAP